MAARRDVDAVIFDLGGVLALNGRPSDAASSYRGADPDMVVAAVMGPYGQDTDHPWHQLERGEITLIEYQTRVRPILESRGVVRSAEVADPAPRPSRTWRFEPNPAMLELVVELRAAGLRTGMLTNNVREIRALWWTSADWPALFDDIVDSHEVGMRKPNPAIYELALERLRVRAGRAAFLDDVESNVAGAVAVGLVGIHVPEDDVEGAIAAVRRLAALD